MVYHQNGPIFSWSASWHPSLTIDKLGFPRNEYFSKLKHLCFICSLGDPDHDDPDEDTGEATEEARGPKEQEDQAEAKEDCSFAFFCHIICAI